MILHLARLGLSLLASQVCSKLINIILKFDTILSNLVKQTPISFMNKIKSKGPRIDSCGTPNVTMIRSEEKPLITTCCVLLYIIRSEPTQEIASYTIKKLFFLVKTHA